MAVIPYLGSAWGAAAALVGLGVMNGFGNVVMITAFQRWAPPNMLGRLSGVLMLASFGVFPISVVLAAVVVHDLGPAAFFPLAAAVLVLAILLGISQRSWRNFGATADLSGPIPDHSASAPIPDHSPSDPTPDHSQPGTVPAAPQTVR